jgi:hypothetical protein
MGRLEKYYIFSPTMIKKKEISFAIFLTSKSVINV